MLNRDFRAAFEAAALDHCATSLGRNTCAKTVRLSTMALVWLKCSFWHIVAIIAIFAIFLKDFCKMAVFYVLAILIIHIFDMFFHTNNRGGSWLWKSSTSVLT